MTIEVLEQLKKYCEGKSNTEKVEISVINLNRIINVLERDQCGDCISREAALDDSGLGEFHRYDDYVKMRNYLKSLPSVTPMPKIGHWIKCIDDNGSYYLCSACRGGEDCKFDFCPNCGSDMRGVEK